MKRKIKLSIMYVRRSIKRYPVTKVFLKLIGAEIAVVIMQYTLPTW